MLLKPASGGIDKKEPSELDIAIDKLAFRKSFTSNEEIYGAKELADYFYKVISGCVRAYMVGVDGRRLIAAFYLPGDVFGLELTQWHQLSAEAVSSVEILVVNRNAVMSLAERETALARDLWARMAAEVHHAQRHLLLLNKSAAERVATFLLEMVDRIQLSDENALPMGRDDIADYLALRSETVSRVLSKLESASAVALRTTRHIVLRNRALLEQMVT